MMLQHEHWFQIRIILSLFRVFCSHWILVYCVYTQLTYVPVPSQRIRADECLYTRRYEMHLWALGNILIALICISLREPEYTQAVCESTADMFIPTHMWCTQGPLKKSKNTQRSAFSVALFALPCLKSFFDNLLWKKL